MSARMSLADALARISRVALVDAPTPIQPLKRIEEVMGSALNGVKLYVKRDDLMGLGGGGNKLRKLEYLMGDAAANGCDTIIATGGIQSNFTRVTAAACARHKVACELVLARLVPETTPGGGSNSISALGYVRCALELDTQLNSNGLDDAIIVTANGSNGTHAGLLAGFKALGRSPHRLRAFTVLANAENSRNSTLAMANGSLELLGASDRLDIDDVRIADDQRGRGYGLVTDAMIEAVRLMASCEGLLLDPVYSGKAFAGVIGDVRSGRYPAGSSVVFLMTGGASALFAYRSAFARKDARS